MMAKIILGTIGALNFASALGACAYMLAADRLTLVPALLAAAGVAGMFLACLAIEALTDNSPHHPATPSTGGQHDHA